MPSCGPGYASPMESFEKGPREKLLYIPCICTTRDKPDYLATIDVDPQSSTYQKVVHRLEMPNLGDEIHHTGWNACSSCHDDPSRSRSHLVITSLVSSRVYFIDMSDAKRPKFASALEPEDLFKHGVSTPHTPHCLANGDIMISCMGDGPTLNGKGGFLLIDGKTFKIKDTYAKDKADIPPFGYDFWYQPYHNVMISTEWAHVRLVINGLNLEDLADPSNFGSHLNVFHWNEHKLAKRIDLGSEGLLPLEIRFLHNPKATEGFVGAALNANVYRFFKTNNGDWDAEKVIDVPAKKVEGWALPEMPGIMTYILISMDDKYLYVANWIHGDVRQYNITDTKNPKLAGQVWIGGSITKDKGFKVLEDQELKEQPDPAYVKGKRVRGGPQMLQLSLDGQRLYVTTSLFSPWDKQFYPELCTQGAMLVQVDVDHDNGGMKLNEDFCVDFGEEPDGPRIAHEIRYPGGDCTSDIYLFKTDACSKK